MIEAPFQEALLEAGGESQDEANRTEDQRAASAGRVGILFLVSSERD